MFFWVIKTIILSFLFIFSAHYTYKYFKNNLTVPKVKDLVKKPIEQYKKIYEGEKEEKIDNEQMKNELKDYLKNLSRGDSKTKIENAGDLFNDSSSSSFTSY